jgi:GGDEF domain-containing protein
MVTASVGTCCIRLDDLAQGVLSPTLDDLVTAADDAMYRAKRLGGDRFDHHGLYRKSQYVPEQTLKGA